VLSGGGPDDTFARLYAGSVCQCSVRLAHPQQGRDLPSQFSSQFGSVQPLAGVAIIAPTSRMLRDGPV
jgi:hypothetical protein